MGGQLSDACKLIGDIRHFVTIQTSTRAQDSTGGFSPEKWESFGQYWASISPLSARQQLWASQLEHRVTHKMTIRYVSGITIEMRVKWGERIFHIQGIINIEERNRFLELMLEEGSGS